MAGEPLTDADRKRILDLHADGLGRNEIARQVKRSASTVTAIVQGAGLTFERRAEVISATVAKMADARKRRAELALGLVQDAERLRAQMFAKTITFNIGGKDNVYTEQEIPEPTFRDKRDIMQAVSTALTTAIRLDDADRNAGSEDAKSTLGELMAGLKRAWNEANPQ